MGVEPTLSAWKADVLPLYDTCIEWEREAVLTGLLGGEGSAYTALSVGTRSHGQRGCPRLSGVSFQKESEEAAAKSYSMTTFLIDCR